jgi:hypothetical protein
MMNMLGLLPGIEVIEKLLEVLHDYISIIISFEQVLKLSPIRLPHPTQQNNFFLNSIFKKIKT